MAKKKQDLSPEERLAAALVPEKEWPYALPDGWKWVRLLGGAATCMDNKRKPVNSKERANRIGEIPYYGATGQVGWIDEYLTNEELILLGEDGAPFLDILKTKAYIINGKSWVNNHAHILKSFMGHIGNSYLMYYLNNFDYRKYVSGTTRLKLTQGKMKNIPVPYPPLSEQRRLVARIESLFAKLDAAKDKVQSVLDSHETRKAALLHAAFTGKLTAKWREEQGIPQSWKNGKLLDCLLEKPRNGYSPKAVNYPTKCKSMSLSATTDGIFKKEYYKYIDEEIPADSYLWLEPGDILIQRSNSLEKVGISAIYTGGTHEYIYPDLMMKLQVNNQNDPAYINYFLQRAETRAYFLSNATGIAGNMPKINQKTVSNTPVNYPSLTEQQEIVRILDRLLAREQRARQAAEETLTAIDRMKQSILARAFRGEL